MNDNTRQALIKFTNSSTWHTSQGLDDNNFTDFIITAFLNGDKFISRQDFESCFSEKIDGIEYKISNLHSRYSEGIHLLSRAGFE